MNATIYYSLLIVGHHAPRRAARDGARDGQCGLWAVGCGLWAAGAGNVPEVLSEQLLRNPNLLFTRGGEGLSAPSGLVLTYLTNSDADPRRGRTLRGWMRRLMTGCGAGRRRRRRPAPATDTTARSLYPCGRETRYESAGAVTSSTTWYTK